MELFFEKLGFFIRCNNQIVDIDRQTQMHCRMHLLQQEITNIIHTRQSLSLTGTLFFMKKLVSAVVICVWLNAVRKVR